MKNIQKRTRKKTSSLRMLAVLFQIVITLNAFSQSEIDKRFKFYTTIGYPNSVIDGKSSFAITGGIGMEIPIDNRLAIETQISTAQFTFDRQYDVLAHDGGYVQYYTGNIGLRYYWNGAQKKHPFFTNLLYGGALRFDKEYNGNDELIANNFPMNILGSGTYVIINNRVIAGLAVVAGIDKIEVILSANIGYRF